MLDKTITSALLNLRAQIIRHKLEGIKHVEALLIARSVTLPSPTHFAERFVCGFFASFVNGAKAQGASGGGKEEMLGHDALLSLLM